VYSPRELRGIPMRIAPLLEALSMLKNLTLAWGLMAGLSACAAPYGYPGYGSSPAPSYYGPDYPNISRHGTVQP
jgi:hypothetical protein